MNDECGFDVIREELCHYDSHVFIEIENGLN